MTDLIWNNEKRVIHELMPHPNNPRQLTEAQAEVLKKSLETFGLVEIPAIDTDNTILAGHQRLKIMILLGREYEEIDVRVPNRKLTEAERDSYNILSNKATGEWDWNILANWNQDLLLDSGFTKLELSKGFDLNMTSDPKEDEVPEIDANAPPIVQLADVWILGRHKLMCGDSTKAEDVERLMEGQKANMVYNDPPYGMFLDADFSGMEGMAKGNKYANVIGDHNDFTNNFILKPLEIFKQCKEIFMWGADYYAEILPNRNDGSWIVWDKMQNGEGVNDAYDKMFGSNFELCWSKNKHKRAIARILWKGIFGLNKEPGGKRVHPTQKPVELSEWFLTKFSKQNEIIVDLFGGSGSTLIACEKTNRLCRMMEIDPHYCDVIIKRWEDFTGQKAILKTA